MAAFLGHGWRHQAAKFIIQKILIRLVGSTFHVFRFLNISFFRRRAVFGHSSGESMRNIMIFYPMFDRKMNDLRDYVHYHYESEVDICTARCQLHQRLLAPRGVDYFSGFSLPFHFKNCSLHFLEIIFVITEIKNEIKTEIKIKIN
jgi:hypothetical protein